MRTNLPICLVVSSIVTLCAATDCVAVVQLKGTAAGRLDQGSAVLDEDYAGGVNLPDNGSTGVHSVMNSHLFSGAISSASLAASSIGGAAGSIGASDYPASGSSFRMVGGENNIYSDELTVTSATLPAGAPVTLMFSYDVFFTMNATSSRGVGGGSNNMAQAQLNISSLVTSINAQIGMNDSFYIASADNNALINTNTGAVLTKGIFSGAQHLDVFLDSEVGARIDFNVSTDADAVVNVAPFYTGGMYTNQTGSAFSSVGIAFGASPSVAYARGGTDVVLQSARTGGVFPSATDANAVNAEAGAPESPRPPAVPGDFDGDGHVDEVDYFYFADCMNGPDAAPMPTEPDSSESQCLDAFDFDKDGNIDHADYVNLSELFGQ